MLDLYLAKIKIEEFLREADKYRLLALARESRKKRRRQGLKKFASNIGLTQTYKIDGIQMHENHKDVSLVEPKESAALCCEAATLD